MTTNELRTKRARIWEEAKAFLDSHRELFACLALLD